MSLHYSVQESLFRTIKENLDPNLSLVDEVGEILSLSSDSTYRRIRGETIVSLDEAAKLCSHFKLSLDTIVHSGRGEVVFNFQPLHEVDFTFMDYLRHIRDNMKLIASVEDKEVVYMANEIPLFHLINVPELAAFKLFFWQKTILDFSQFRNGKFKLYVKDEEVNEISREIRDLYFKIPSVEIYNSETIDTSLKQIEYYYVTGYFQERKEALILLDKLDELVDHIKLQCEMGFKFNRNKERDIPEYVAYQKEGNYEVYHNEVLHSDNLILVRLGDRFLTFLTSNGVNVLSTTSAHFHEEANRVISTLKRKSTLISGTSEKERNRVFLTFHEKIENLRKRLS